MDYVDVQGVLFADWDFETIVLSWKVVVLLIFTNSIFKQQNLELWTVSKYKGFYLLIQSYKRSYTGSAVLEGGRSADIHEMFFQAAKSSDMEFVDLQGCLFAFSSLEKFR